ncbi:MAG: hypothetical protein IH948_08540 [Bacteroidetes bacterium]|nr:hypothetical protein [Bacteroidota bacterium]
MNSQLLEITLKALDIKHDIVVSKGYIEKGKDSLDIREQFNLRKKPHFSNSPYIQVFSDTGPFLEDLSIIDLIFNMGTEAGNYLKNCIQ